MLTLRVNGEALRRLENVPEGGSAEAWRRFVEHCEPKQSNRLLGMLRQIFTYDFGNLGQVIDRIEQFRLMVSKYRDQSGQASLTMFCKQRFMLEIISLFTREGLTLSRRWLLKSKPSHAPGLEDRISFL